MAAIGWYGPLIDLSSASSHLPDYVQLLVFVHRSTPVQYKASAASIVIRTDIQVGDDTRPFFSVSLWGNNLSSSISAGDIVLLQNVKITRFASFVEAKTVHYSSTLRLVHPFESLFCKGIDELVGSCRVGETVKEKLRKVIRWVQQQKSTLRDHMLSSGKPATKNWKVQEEHISCKYQLLSQVLHLRTSSRAVFRASVGEIFLPHLQHEPEKERMFIRKRLIKKGGNIVEDVICTGCQICGCPLGLVSSSKLKNGPFFCEKSSNHQHSVAVIYRPFMLYVWDGLEYMPILVKNKAAEILFGNIGAEKVYQSYKGQVAFQKLHKSSNATADTLNNHNKEADRKSARLVSPTSDESVANRAVEFYLIWLILLKMLLFQGKNSPLEFVVSVSPSLEIEDGRFEMVSMLMPCFHC